MLSSMPNHARTISGMSHGSYNHGGGTIGTIKTSSSHRANTSNASGGTIGTHTASNNTGGTGQPATSAVNGFVNTALNELAVHTRRNSSHGPNPKVQAELKVKQGMAPLSRPNCFSVNRYGTLSQSMI